MTQGTSMAMIVASFPSQERGRVLGLQMSIVGLGGIAGPALGGLLVGELGWQWAFFGTAAMGVVAILAALVIVDSRRSGLTDRRGVKFDWGGAALSTGALIVILQAMTWAPTLGYGNPAIAAAFAVFAALLAVFILHELRAAFPMMDVRLFKRRLFSLGVIASFLNFLGSQSVRFLMPFYLQAVLGLHPTQVGLIIVPGAVSMMITGPLSGRLSDRFGWRWFTVGGMLVSAAGLLILSTLQPDSHITIADGRDGNAERGHRHIQRAEQQLDSERRRAEQVRCDHRIPQSNPQLREPVQHSHRDGHRHRHDGIDGI